MNNFLFRLMIICHHFVKGMANRILDKRYIRPRNFSNLMLKKYAPYFSGDVINVSGWKDEDGEGGYYRRYFNNNSSYTVSNVFGQEKGLGSAKGDYKEIELDLLTELPVDLVRKFDIVFNHTTLEHVYDFKGAFKHICELSKDIVIIVVPVMQQIHHTEDFGDYWRPTTMTIAKLFKENGLEPLVIKCNDQPFAPIYCFAIASRNSTRYANKFKKKIDFEMGKYNYGSSLEESFIKNLI